MKFSSETKMLSFLIHNYQFPELNDTNSSSEFDYDANWLNVMLTLKDRNSTFVQIDPFLLTTEVKEIMDWLHSLPNPSMPVVSFTEPSFQLEFLGKHSLYFHIRVTLCLELLPPWSNNKNKYETDFAVTPEEIRECIHSLYTQLLHYPIRF